MAISLYVAGRSVVIVGSGAGAAERAQRSAGAGAVVTRVSAAEYTAERCRGAFLVMAQTDDHELDRRVAGDAAAMGCLCYAHDQPEISDLAMPALASRGALSLAIATDGLAPTLARRLRAELQALLDGAGERLDRLIASMVAERAALPPAQRGRRMRALADRVRIRGRLDVGDPDGDLAADAVPDRGAGEAPDSSDYDDTPSGGG